jgi:bacteriocin biosynthesis cyclodehydratase domain-containing protein
VTDAPSTPPALAAGGRRFRLRCSVDCWHAPDGDLYLVRVGEPDLRVRGPGALDVALVDALGAGDRTVGELAALLGAPAARIEEKLAALAAAGVVASWTGAADDELDDAEADRFSRQLPYLAEFGAPPRVQRALRSAHVLVAGTGGLGSWIVAALCAAGIGRFTLVDPDRVELSNLNRQILFGLDSVGRPKVGETERWIAAFDPGIDVTALPIAVDGPAAFHRLLPDVDVLVLAADSPPYELARWANAACMERGVPFVTAGQQPPLVKIGPTYVPGRTACFACHETALRRESPLYDEYVRHVRDAPRPGATLGPASGIAGAMVAMDVVHLLATGSCATSGAALILDLSTFEIRRHPLPRDERCETCRKRVAGAVSPRVPG